MMKFQVHPINNRTRKANKTSTSPESKVVVPKKLNEILVPTCTFTLEQFGKSFKNIFNE